MSKRVYIETYGCQMNVADSELIATLLRKNNYILASDIADADVILINTCSIRDNAEQRIFKRISELQSLKKKNKFLKIGIIGCMAEHLGNQLFDLEDGVNFLAGPDSYRKIARIIENSENDRVTDIVLSHTETYEDIIPEKLLSSGISAFVPIMRGCENFCTYCVVPYTRGRERSRSPHSIAEELAKHVGSGVKEITLLGQNVNSYIYQDTEGMTDFPDLLSHLALKFPDIRFRFATSHPKDISDKLLYCIANHPNICRSVHLPVQSGSTSVLKRMNRKYTRESYLERIGMIRKIIPGCIVSTDIITGFCGETEEEHLQTLSLMKDAGFFYAFMFKYSERPGTIAAKTMKDDVPKAVKTRRLTEIISLQQELSLANNRNDMGKVFEVLVEGYSKRSVKEIMGRTSENKVVVFEGTLDAYQPGTLVTIRINDCTSATLMGKVEL